MAEFNAWLEGFEEAIDGTPTKAQWMKIRAKLDTVVPDIITSPVYPLPSWPLAQPMRLPFPHELQWTWSTTGTPASATTISGPMSTIEENIKAAINKELFRQGYCEDWGGGIVDVDALVEALMEPVGDRCSGQH